jgi:uncharacterized protein (DUF58 family)
MKSQLLMRTVFYKKIFGGRGFEFDSFRNYSPENDDAGLIDWKATKRASKTLVRQYVEERDLKVFIILDVGDNMVFGSGEKLKNEVAAEIVAALSHLIISSGDSVGVALFSDSLVKMIPLSGGMAQFNIISRALENPNNYGGKSNLKKNLKFILPTLKNISAVFIISDFINIDDETLKTMKTFSSTYETVGIMVHDRVDFNLPDIKNEIVIEDIYTGQQKIINPTIIRREYESYANEQKNKVINTFRKTGSDLIELITDSDYALELSKFLKTRIKRRKFLNS